MVRDWEKKRFKIRYRYRFQSLSIRLELDGRYRVSLLVLFGGKYFLLEGGLRASLVKVERD